MRNGLFGLHILFLVSYNSVSQGVCIRTVNPGTSSALDIAAVNEGLFRPCTAISSINTMPEPDRELLLTDPVIKKELKIEKVFTSIRIEGDISLVLTNAPAGTIIIEGKEKKLQKIGPVFENNILVIDANRKPLLEKLTIYLSAITLQVIQLNGDGNISSNDFIQSGYLHISLNGNIKVKVKTMGELSFDTPDDIELIRRP